MDFMPTLEQFEILEAFAEGNSLVVEALAGTGKTSTLKLCSEITDRQGLYLAFNTSIAKHAQNIFGENVAAATAHSMAWRKFGAQNASRMENVRPSPREVAEHLKIKSSLDVGGRYIKNTVLGRLAGEMVQRYCWSKDDEIGLWHRPFVEGLDEGQLVHLAKYLLPVARAYWSDVCNPQGSLRFTHDHYLKMWQLSKPRLFGDFLLFDEAQDANPVIEDVVKNQDMQLIMVGDAQQAIYGWRGAEDALSRFEADQRLSLTQSFRFGPAIADAANRLLELLPTQLRVQGYSQVHSEVRDLPDAGVVLCRSNAGALTEVIDALDLDIPVCLIGNASTEIVRFCRGVDALKDGRPTAHPELCVFQTWGQVQDYVDDDDKSEFALMVKLVDRFGTDVLIDALGKTVEERKATLVVSTTHKAKGREWPEVRLAKDFRAHVDKEGFDATPGAAELRLQYVATTRAQHILDPGALKGVLAPVKVLVP